MTGRTHTTRRDFIARSAAAVTAAALAPRARAADPVPSAIDAHVHVWTPDTERYPLADGFTKADMKPASFTPDQLFAHARPCGVGRVVLIQMSYYGFDNSYMLDAIADHPGVFRGVAVIDPTDRPAETMKALKAKGVSGFRIRDGEGGRPKWVGNPDVEAMWKCGADENLAMCGLVNPDFLPEVDRACAKFPKTPVVIDHFGRVGIDGTIRGRDLDNLCRLARHPNANVKVSAFYALGKKRAPYADLGPMIRKVRDAFGADRLMWASDAPFQVEGEHTYAASIDLIREGLDFLTAAERQALFGKTAERVYFR